MKKWIFLLAVCFGFSTQASAQEQIARQEDKIYVSPDRIRIVPDGIFYMNEVGEFQPVNMVSSDEGGVFIVSNQIQCSTCRAWSSDGNLHKFWCPFYKG
jgi:hypothetical protein